MNTDQVGGIIRSILLAGAGYFVGKGIVDQASATAIVSALVGLITTGWSIYSNRNAKLVAPKPVA